MLIIVLFHIPLFAVHFYVFLYFFLQKSLRFPIIFKTQKCFLSLQEVIPYERMQKIDSEILQKPKQFDEILTGSEEGRFQLKLRELFDPVNLTYKKYVQEIFD